MPAKSGALSAVGAASAEKWFRPSGLPHEGGRPASFWWTISRATAFAATVALERSTDDGATWERLTYVDGTPMEWTGPVCTVLPELEHAAIYRPVVTAHASGVVTWKLGR